ncbi:metallophosphoesterase [Pseudoclavibacter endophyticus]|nr:metallophosphoesterase [Pseudoclavibacter endophyticus]GGA69988.1 metallophosphoesterase [Pseudoclavibacter endophyticus]
MYAWAVERVRFRLRRVAAPVLPPGSADVRVLHLSDLHLAPWQTMKHDFVRSLADLGPDLVVNTGDNLGHPDVLPQLRELLAPFRGVPGVFVYGSNDYFGPTLKNPFTYFFARTPGGTKAPRLDVDGLDALLDELGWASLNNAATLVSAGGRQFRAVGVNDPHIGYDRPDAAIAALGSLPAADASGNELPVLALAHAPYRRILDEFTRRGAAAIFAGHTHGGQVCLPGYGALVTNCDVPREQARGLTAWRAGGRETALHVSAGLGTSIYSPVRFACPPEATLVTLTARSA